MKIRVRVLWPQCSEHVRTERRATRSPVSNSDLELPFPETSVFSISLKPFASFPIVRLSIRLSDLHLINCHSEVGQTERRVALLASRCDRRLAPIMPRDVHHILHFLNVTSGNVFLSRHTSFNTVSVRGLEQRKGSKIPTREVFDSILGQYTTSPDCDSIGSPSFLHSNARIIHRYDHDRFPPSYFLLIITNKHTIRRCIA